ncbi:gamma-glutamylcyclotransferase family protein [Myxococcus sp. AB036A]|nr:gamma-glutamylcyclotransferase family protein [Myxococcus sp. AB036A]
MLSFAYGSNLDRAQMRARCPNATVEARATLPGHTLEPVSKLGEQA